MDPPAATPTASPAKLKKHRDEFEVPNKHRIKLEKKDRKQSLRKTLRTHNLKESPVNSDDEENLEKIVSKGQHWWHKANHRFFRELTQTELRELHRRITGDELLALKYPARVLQNYLQEELAPLHPVLTNGHLLHVLFHHAEGKQEINHIASFAFRQYSSARDNPEMTLSQGLRLDSLRIPPEEIAAEPPSQSPGSQEEQCLDLDLFGMEQREEQVLDILRYDATTTENEQIERQILLLERQLQGISVSNLSNWKEMLNRMETHPPTPHLQPEVTAIRRDLRMAEVLLYFQRGHSDKTEEMLQQALEVSRIKDMSSQGEGKTQLTRLEKLKQIFETDCKICFYTGSEDRNKVVYCDDCNTSFHQACYGVEQLPKEKFYCEVCIYLRTPLTSTSPSASSLPPQDKDNKDSKDSKDCPSRKQKRPQCHLCYKHSFPMKLINNRFYHVTCLVLFELAEIKNYHIQFREGITPASLLEAVVQNELSHGQCEFCLKEIGMKFGCSWVGCEVSYHPICAYLNGVYFDLERSYRSLTCALTCPEHYPDRDHVHQTYLRRFFCDYNAASTLTDSDFQTLFVNENLKRSLKLQDKQRELQLGVLLKGRYTKPIRAPYHRSKPTLLQKQKKDSQAQNVQRSTETDKLRKMISQNSHAN